ncbi:MAG: hypothetical protein DMF77_07510 [Acidobacteria bacterium]|nr:MAG: hypothetical protein DMF77_07510 [Acidobacteriota bacterium]
MRVGIYLADQVWRLTSSKGIYAYSRLLTAALLRGLPAHDWTLIVNGENHGDMVPAGSAAHVVELPAACARGGLRLLADQVLAPLVAGRRQLDLLHFPKGFTPVFSGATRLTATVHDIIPIHYARDHPGHFPRAQLRYLHAMFLNTLRRATAVATDSEFSRGELLALARENAIAPPPIEVCSPTPAPALVRDEGPPASSRPAQLLHLGSPLPHKRTAQTIRLFRRYNLARGRRWRMRVTGLSAPPRDVEAGDDVEYLGSVGADALRDEMAGARALLLLSSIEGFGLPALEAWFVGTPVCYAAAGSLPEVLEGVPGRCESPTDDAFAEALDAVLTLEEAQRVRIARHLRERYGMDAFRARVENLFSQWMAAPRRTG